MSQVGGPQVGACAGGLAAGGRAASLRRPPLACCAAGCVSAGVTSTSRPSLPLLTAPSSLMANPSWATEADNVAAVCAASGALVRSLLVRPREHSERAAGLVRARLHLGAVLGKVAAAEVQRDHNVAGGGARSAGSCGGSGG